MKIFIPVLFRRAEWPSEGGDGESAGADPWPGSRADHSAAAAGQAVRTGRQEGTGHGEYGQRNCVSSPKKKKKKKKNIKLLFASFASWHFLQCSVSSVESHKGVNAVQRCPHWEPEGRYCCTNSMALAPFWFSTVHCWTALIPFWLSADDMHQSAQNIQYDIDTVGCRV